MDQRKTHLRPIKLAKWAWLFFAACVVLGCFPVSMSAAPGAQTAKVTVHTTRKSKRRAHRPVRKPRAVARRRAPGAKVTPAAGQQQTVPANANVSPPNSSPGPVGPIRGPITVHTLANDGTGNPINGGILNGKAVVLPKPAYPPVAKAAHASGSVEVKVTIDENGQVISAEAISGHPLLRAAAIQAARSSRFAPTLLNGQPVRVVGVILYEFIAD